MKNEKRTILITGSTTGIGKAGALELAQRGWKVFLHARSAARGAPVLAELRSLLPDADLSLATGDFASLAEVTALAGQVKSQVQKLDVLWNNAGLMLNERKIGTDGWEMTMTINHLSTFLLTRELLPLIEQTQGRVITTSSGAYAMGKFDWSDWMDERSRYSSFKAYSKSKLANILFTRELARQVEAKGITAHCYHPGFIRSDFGKAQRGVSANSSRSSWPDKIYWFSPQAGADTAVFLADELTEKQPNGKFWIKRKIRKTNGNVNDENAKKLWELSEQATKQFSSSR